jgi:hypothetical protein
VTEATVAETSIGPMEIEFGINRWVVVSIGSETAQEQIRSKSELAGYLRRRGLLESEARDIARTAWRARPRDAETRSASASESLVGATGLSSGTVLLIVIFLVAVLAALAFYAASHWPSDSGL